MTPNQIPSAVFLLGVTFISSTFEIYSIEITPVSIGQWCSDSLAIEKVAIVNVSSNGTSYNGPQADLGNGSWRMQKIPKTCFICFI